MKIPLTPTKVYKNPRLARQRVLIRPEHNTQLSRRLTVKHQKKKESTCGRSQQGADIIRWRPLIR